MNSRIQNTVATGRADTGDGLVEWYAAGRSAPGELVSGDRSVVVTWDNGALIGLIDALGHGEEAADAAEQAALVLQRSAQLPLVPLVQACHVAIRATRGVVLTLVAFNGTRGAATAIGVGNVEGHVFRRTRDAGVKRQSILLRGGVVGYQLPRLQVCELVFAPGDRLLLATDGVRPDFADGITWDEPLPNLVERTLARSWSGTDDGTVVACTYKGVA